MAEGAEWVQDSDNVLDVVGVGFGPSNLALAIALAESGGACRALFLEKQPTFGWHTGMLLEDATMQVSFLKDLVTMRTPTSSFSFVNFLHEKGRLTDFINHKSFFPLRLEFHDYLRWAADRLPDVVHYDAEVVAIQPVPQGNGRISLLDVVVHRGGDPTRVEIHRTRNVVLAIGLQPNLPAGISPSDRIWHSEDLLTRLARLPETPTQLTVVGAGQSAAEVTAHLHERFPDAMVRAVFSRYGYSPADNSPFANRIFDPGAVDDYFGAPDGVKQQLDDYHRNTNYSVVDEELLSELYRRTYQERVIGRRRLHIMNASRLTDVTEHTGGVTTTTEFLPTGQRSTFESDLVIFGTGYSPGDPVWLLNSLAADCKRDDQGRLRVTRTHRVVTSSNVTCGIYLQGPTEHTHGISSTLLSTTAVRAGELATALRASIMA